MPKTTPPLSDVIPPLIFGTAVFNHQYNSDPFSMPSTTLVHHAISSGISAFDTSPYYGPSEEILGAALAAPVADTKAPFPRDQYKILTKVGRISADEFDYSPEWIRTSIARSLKRLHTDYLDVVYCHDVEFVTPAEALGAIKELRKIRDEDGSIKYVGISGFPVGVLCDLADMILRETGEPLDIIQSYGNYTLQNTLLKTQGVQRLKDAGLSVVPNASILGMGLLRSQGVPSGSMGNWHPAPDGLRKACQDAAQVCKGKDETLENVATRWSLEHWLVDGADVGTASSGVDGQKIGVSVIGVSNLVELEGALKVWQSVQDGVKSGVEESKKTDSLNRRRHIDEVVVGIHDVLGKWRDFAWDSPDKDFVNKASK
jgi:aryl-alcohol dehydrogenase-like predicted oxidoreductase